MAVRELPLCTGKEFNECNPRITLLFVEHTRDLIRDVSIKSGLNFETKYINPVSAADWCGFDLIERDYLLRWIHRNLNEYTVRQAVIPDESAVYLKSSFYFRTNMVELSDPIKLVDYLSGEKIEPMLRAYIDTDSAEDVALDEVIANVFYLGIDRCVEFDLVRIIPNSMLSNQALQMAIELDSDSIIYIPHNLLTTDLCMRTVKREGLNLAFVPDKLKTKDISIAAIQRNVQALNFVPVKYITQNLCKICVETDGLALEYVPEHFINNEICIAAIKQNACALRYVPDQMRTHEMCARAVKLNGLALAYVPNKIMTPELEELAMKQNEYAMAVRKRDNFFRSVQSKKLTTLKY